MITIHRLNNKKESLRGINRLLPQLSASGNFTLIDQKRLQRCLRNSDFYVFVVCDSTKQYPENYIGLGTVFFQWNLGHCIAEIHDVVIDTEYRGQNLGNRITKRLISEARRFSQRHKTELKLYLTSRAKRKAANQMYRKHGFVLVAKATGPWGTNLYKMVILPDGSIKTPTD